MSTTPREPKGQALWLDDLNEKLWPSGAAIRVSQRFISQATSAPELASSPQPQNLSQWSRVSSFGNRRGRIDTVGDKVMPSLDDVYRKFGEVAEAAQLLETELGTMQLCVQGIEHDLFAGDKGELATEIYNKINKTTLGQLLKQLARPAGLSGNLELLLAQALAERNQLFHSFFPKHNFRRNSDEGRAKMLEDLERKHETILEAYKAVMRLSGIDLDKLTNVPTPTTHVRI
jgi:hypothetical protein